jgi:hypothetical protein
MSVVVIQLLVNECVPAVVSFHFGVVRVAHVSDLVVLPLRGADERMRPLCAIRSAQRGDHPDKDDELGVACCISSVCSSARKLRSLLLSSHHPMSHRGRGGWKTLSVAHVQWALYSDRR